MRTPHVDDRVRLLGSLPNTALCRGSVGVVCSEWAGRDRGEPLFEVEFKSPVGGEELETSRRLVPLTQIELAEDEAAGV